MSISIRGSWLLIRPQLGRLRRIAYHRANRLRISGRPAYVDPAPTNPVRAKVMFWYAIVLRSVGLTPRATETLAEAIALDPRYPEWHRRLGDLRRGRLEYAKAAQSYEDALTLDPRSKSAHFWLAVSINQPEPLDATSARHRRRRRRDAAAVERALDAARRSDIPVGSFAFWLGVAEHHLGRLAEAERLYSDAVATEPSNPLWFRQLASVRSQLGDWQGAVASYEVAYSLHQLQRGDGVSEAIRRDTTSLRLTAEAFDTAFLLADGQPEWMEALRSQRVQPRNWAVVASLYRTALEQDELTPSHDFFLGVALEQLGDWEAAVGAFRRAVERDPTHASWYHRLGKSMLQLDEWHGSAVALQIACELEPSGDRYFDLAVALQRQQLWQQSAEAYEQAVRLDGPDASRVYELGSVQREMENWAGAAALYRSSLEQEDHPDYWFLLGFSLERLEDWGGAIAAYETAIAKNGSHPRWLYRLGLAHERFGSPSVDANPRIGLVRNETSNLAASIECYRRALELDDTNIRYWMRLGHVYERVGELELARDTFSHATCLDPQDSQPWYRLGRCIAAIANRRGAYLITEHDELERTLGRAVELNPGHSGARQQLVRASVKDARWETASRFAWYPVPSHGPSELFGALRTYLETPQTVQTLHRLRDALSRPYEELRLVPVEWWFPLHWRLLTEGHLTLGYRAKEVMAEQVARRDFDHPDDNLSGFLEKGRALTFLGRLDEALDHLGEHERDKLSDFTRSALKKMAADVELLNGHVDPYESMLTMNDDTNPPAADSLFRELVVGRRIAIVGPALTELDHGADIDGFDVVIRTKFVSDTIDDHQTSAGSRTDISYYALGSARFLQSDIMDALATGALKQAVFRTATFDRTIPWLNSPGDVRYVPSEFTAGFRSGQFAIQRIIYDLLRYRPSSIKVFNINFFLSPEAYRPGYLASYTDNYQSLGLTQVLGAFGHDYLADFTFTRRLHEAGLIDVDDEVGMILALTPEQYLNAMDSRVQGDDLPAN
jgi:tetratricopeptide (TPR) repeat protein